MIRRIDRDVIDAFGRDRPQAERVEAAADGHAAVGREGQLLGPREEHVSGLTVLLVVGADLRVHVVFPVIEDRAGQPEGHLVTSYVVSRCGVPPPTAASEARSPRTGPVASRAAARGRAGIYGLSTGMNTADTAGSARVAESPSSPSTGPEHRYVPNRSTRTPRAQTPTCARAATAARWVARSCTCRGTSLKVTGSRTPRKLPRRILRAGVPWFPCVKSVPSVLKPNRFWFGDFPGRVPGRCVTVGPHQVFERLLARSVVVGEGNAPFLDGWEPPGRNASPGPSVPLPGRRHTAVRTSRSPDRLA